MAGVVNRLVGAQSLLSAVNTGTSWSSSNMTVTIDGASELLQNSGTQYKQLKCVLNSPNTSGTLSLNEIQLSTGDANRPLVFVFAVKMAAGGTVTTTLTHDDEPLTEIVTTSVNLQQSAAAVNAPGVLSPQWFVYRTDPLTIVEPEGIPSVSISIQFTPTNTAEAFYFTTPALYQQYEFAVNNDAVTTLAARLPEIMVDIDTTADVVPDVPLLRFLDVASLGLGDSLRYVRDFAYLDISEGYDDSDNSTKSTMVNSDVATFAYLVWLAKFSGTSPVTRFESSLEYVADAFVLGATEGDGGSTLNSTDMLRLTSYTSLNPPALTEAEQETLLRWQLDYGYYGRNAGTIPAITEAAKLMLVGTEYVGVAYDYDAEPFTIDIQTKWSETYGAIGPEVIGQSSELVLEAVSYARPLGTLIRHEMIA